MNTSLRWYDGLIVLSISRVRVPAWHSKEGKKPSIQRSLESGSTDI